MTSEVAPETSRRSALKVEPERSFQEFATSHQHEHRDCRGRHDRRHRPAEREFPGRGDKVRSPAAIAESPVFGTVCPDRKIGSTLPVPAGNQIRQYS
jgi:hypothetical protein